MISKIANILDFIRFGPHLRSEEAGQVRYLKGTHFDVEYELTEFESSYVSKEKGMEKFLLKENDVIVAAKGFRNFAWRYTVDHGPCIASSLFYVIRIRQDLMSSEYFTLLINSPRIQHRLKMMGMGVTIPTIPRKEFTQMKVWVPPKAEQQKVEEVNRLMKHEICLERTILEKKIQRKNGIIEMLTQPE